MERKQHEKISVYKKKKERKEKENHRKKKREKKRRNKKREENEREDEKKKISVDSNLKFRRISGKLIACSKDIRHMRVQIF